MTLKDLLAKQRNLLEAISAAYKAGTYKHPDTENWEWRQDLDLEKVVETRIMILALENELHEFLRELPWKPWKKQNPPIDRQRLKEELADCWHFILEITLLWNLEDEIEGALETTFAKNHKRAQEGY